MKKRMLYYFQYINEFSEHSHSANECVHFRQDFLEHIRFYQHERLIHLIVTCLFTILTFAVFITLLFSFTPGLLLLFAALMVLLVPYIHHYYFLENTIQKMYDLYDCMQDLCKETDTQPDSESQPRR